MHETVTRFRKGSTTLPSRLHNTQKFPPNFYSFSQENNMGLFDSIAEHISGALSGVNQSQQSGILDAAISLINNPQTGGIQGLVKTFEEKGVGGVISSWVGTGENLSISGEQLESIFGSERLQSIGQTLGLSSEEISSHLSNLLPQVIDKITPSGNVIDGDGFDFDKVKGLLSSFLSDGADKVSSAVSTGIDEIKSA
jgi:uncharacterized protein YidB (DUF937 family)